MRFRMQEDAIVTDPKVVIFVDDCTTARCPLHAPKKSSARMRKKLNALDAKLRRDGWMVIRVWQHEVEAAPRTVAGRISMAIKTAQKLEGG